MPERAVTESIGSDFDCRVMTDDQDYLNLVYSSIAGMICNSQERVPITDWYETVDAHHVGFQSSLV